MVWPTRSSVASVAVTLGAAGPLARQPPVSQGVCVLCASAGPTLGRQLCTAAVQSHGQRRWATAPAALPATAIATTPSPSLTPLLPIPHLHTAQAGVADLAILDGQGALRDEHAIEVSTGSTPYVRQEGSPVSGPVGCSGTGEHSQRSKGIDMHLQTSRQNAGALHGGDVSRHMLCFGLVTSSIGQKNRTSSMLRIPHSMPSPLTGLGTTATILTPPPRKKS